MTEIVHYETPYVASVIENSIWADGRRHANVVNNFHAQTMGKVNLVYTLPTDNVNDLFTRLNFYLFLLHFPSQTYHVSPTASTHVMALQYKSLFDTYSNDPKGLYLIGKRNNLFQEVRKFLRTTKIKILLVEAIEQFTALPSRLLHLAEEFNITIWSSQPKHKPEGEVNVQYEISP